MTELRYSEIRSIAAGGAGTHDFIDDVKPHKNVDPKPVAAASGTDTGLSERDQLIELFCDARDKLMKAVPESEWKRLGIGYGPVSGQVFPEACAFELSDIGPQGEPLFRYSEDQPRDPDGKFGSGGVSSKEDQKELRSGYVKEFPAAREKFEQIASKYGVVSGRVKDADSIENKMADNPNYQGKDLGALKDVAGLRCTCKSVDDVRACATALRSQNELKIVGEQENKMDNPQGFYRAIHEGFDSMGENQYGERIGEIQIRTERQSNVAMWGHDMAYKGPFGPFGDSQHREEVQSYARAVSNTTWELDNGRSASYPDAPTCLKERNLAFNPDKQYTDGWLSHERGKDYWKQTS
jgi:ppGpp synthetase/RelA/SpoT-type nucleotidyltranferase